jgi:hypothetical protein
LPNGPLLQIAGTTANRRKVETANMKQSFTFLLVFQLWLLHNSYVNKKPDLNSLLVSQVDIATDGVAQALQGLVSIVKETGEVMPTSAFGKLNNNQKILTYLLGLRACALLGLGHKRVSASAEEIAGIMGGDVQRAREHLSRLKGKFLQKTTEGWHIGVPKIIAACDEIISSKR